MEGKSGVFRLLTRGFCEAEVVTTTVQDCVRRSGPTQELDGKKCIGTVDDECTTMYYARVVTIHEELSRPLFQYSKCFNVTYMLPKTSYSIII